MKTHTHKHVYESPAQTDGRLIRWAAFYDAFANIMTLGHLRRLRTLTIEHALLKPGEERLLIADMKRPGNSFIKCFFTLLVQHGHAMQFGIEDLLELLKEAGFEEIQQLEDRFLTIGFVRATRSAA